MTRINALGEQTEAVKKPLKANIKGKIHSGNRNYGPEDVDGLDPVIPLTPDFPDAMIKQNRQPETVAPDRLPTADLPFYPMDEHNFIGIYESKQNIYLNLAYAFNKAMDRIEALETEVANLKAKVK